MLRLLPPDLDFLPGYAAALEAGWLPDTTRDVSAEQLALCRHDPKALIEELIRQDGTIMAASGELVPRLPSRTFWLDDGEFCGSINFRFARGTDELPSQVPGHIGYAVVPWKRRRRYATEALRLLLPVARANGLNRLRLICDEGNVPSRKVIVANGGVFERRDATPQGVVKLSFCIDLRSVLKLPR
jgi:predicted acetyltransferase